ncbi:MAG TPA: gliding motility-associated ABC transporter substrate-binding protein GldG [Saprospiraceae bacterium]|nr:gliding motility-associated ABC transporter substrate-binding protein GldG [Saprospiraceae bacterium]HNT22170.1 gliding motility-associated ABC transporter substrate-binding protein GldG [Saprospiraceae bacterium]
MNAIIRKELQSYLSSWSLMLAMAAYFLLVGLWLWLFPGTSIPDNKFATLQTLFDLAPWMFLFILPAMTMKSIAEEKITGTLDLLKSKPISVSSLILGKYFAILIVVAVLLLISQVYTWSVYQLGFPKGNLDLGGTLGSFIGWFLLAAAYTSIGILSSAMAPNQMTAFLLAAGLSFLMFTGPSFLSTLPLFEGTLDYMIQWIGIQYHYQSLSRGVLTSQDLFYFIALNVLFLQLAVFAVQANGQTGLGSNRFQKWLLLPVGILLMSGLKLFSLDLTGDKRHTITKESKELVASVRDNIYVKILFTGKFPAAFTRLKKTAVETLSSFNRINKKILFEEVDPLQGDPELVRSNQESLGRDGIVPTRLTVYNGREQEQKIVYPYALFYFGERMIPVSLLESMDPNISEDEVLNRSASLLEYKFANAIQKLQMSKNPVVVFTRGHGELPQINTADLERSLRPVYSTGRLTLDSVVQISPEIDVLVVAKPQRAFSDRDNFLIDQYIMNGGKVLWFIDPLLVNTDTVNAANRSKLDFIPLPYDLNLEELLFKYGCRIQPNIVLDYECSTIPLLAGYSNNTPQFEPRFWYYHPLVVPASNHPVVKNLDRISLFYPATVDTVRTKTAVKKTVLLASSAYSRTQMSPSPVNFEMIRSLEKPEQFNRESQPLGLLLEGVFPSAFENRLTGPFQATLSQIGQSFKTESKPTRMIVYSDGDLVANAVSSRGEPAPLGFNIYEQKTYPSNKNLVLNSIEYLIDEHQVMQARNKELRLRMLDSARLSREADLWRWFNILFPAALVFLLAAVFNYWRKKQYAH